MTSLFLAWQSPVQMRRWYPIGRLEADPAACHYCFWYTQGAQLAAQEAGWRPLEAFPYLGWRYEADELFPLFRNRVLSPTREEYAEYLKLLDLRPEEADPLTLLALTGGRRQTDNLEVFPKLEAGADRSFRCRFFLRGWRRTTQAAQARLAELGADEPLRVAGRLDGPAMEPAVELRIEESPGRPRDAHVVGWAPRYVAEVLAPAAGGAAGAQARLVRRNPPGAPTHQRFLIELTGQWPEGHDPMTGEEFNSIRDWAV